MSLFEVRLTTQMQPIHVICTDYTFLDTVEWQAFQMHPSLDGGGAYQHREKRKLAIFENYTGIDTHYRTDIVAANPQASTSYKFNRWPYWLPAEHIRGIRMVENDDAGPGLWNVSLPGGATWALGDMPVWSADNMFLILMKGDGTEYARHTTDIPRNADGQAVDVYGLPMEDYMLVLGDQPFCKAVNRGDQNEFTHIRGEGKQARENVIKFINYRGRGKLNYLTNPPNLATLGANHPIVAANKSTSYKDDDDLYLPLKHLAAMFQVQHFVA